METENDELTNEILQLENHIEELNENINSLSEEIKVSKQCIPWIISDRVMYSKSKLFAVSTGLGDFNKWYKVKIMK